MKVDTLVAATQPEMSFTELPMKGCEGFRLVRFVDGQVAATESCVRIVNFEVFPDELAKSLQEKSDSGIPTFIGNIAVDQPFLGQGIGPALLKATLRRLTETYPVFIVSDVDDSIPCGWTERRIPDMHQYMEGLGWKVDLLFQGQTDNKPTWVTQYTKDK